MGEEENNGSAALGANGNHALEHEVVLGSEGLSANHHEGGGTHKEGATTEQVTDLSGGEVVKSWFNASLLWKGSSTFDSFLLAQAAQVSLWLCFGVFVFFLSVSLSHTQTHTPQLFYFTLLPLWSCNGVFLLKPILCIYSLYV
jgi:hypothetical protein